MYTQKIIRNLKPNWYLEMSGPEKEKFQIEMFAEHNLKWDNKPKLLPIGTEVIAMTSSESTSPGSIYKVRGHFCTLVTTFYGSNWREFITIKNDNGYTIKVNLKNFRIARPVPENMG